MKTAVKKPKVVIAEEEDSSSLRDGTVALELIVKHPQMGYRRIDKEWAAELGNDIEHNGLDNPPIVWDGGDPDTQMKVAGDLHPASFLIAGLHRVEGLKQFRARNPKGFEKMFPEGRIPVTFKSGPMEDALSAQLRENVQRKDMTVEEIFPVLKRLRDDYGLKGKEIARRVGKSPAWVSEMMQIEDELGEEGVVAVSKKGVTVSDAKKAVRKMRKAKKSGKSVNVEEVLDKASKKAASKKSKNRQRAEKRPSLKTLWKRYNALPKMKLATTIEVLTGMIQYAVGDNDELPEQLEVDDTESDTED